MDEPLTMGTYIAIKALAFVLVVGLAVVYLLARHPE